MILQTIKRVDDRVIRVPVTCCFAPATVDDEFLGLFRDLGIEVVHEHAFGCFLNPTGSRPGVAARCANGAVAAHACRTSCDVRIDGQSALARNLSASAMMPDITRSLSHAGQSTRKAVRAASRRGGPQ